LPLVILPNSPLIASKMLTNYSLWSFESIMHM
jgi:hypothetical protein